MMTRSAWIAGLEVGKLLVDRRAHTVSSPPYCLSHGWSIVTSATTNSTFAGILAGFVFLGVATLIARPGRRNAQALGLLTCAFVVLGFDSYLFSLVTGSGTDTDCSRVWAEGVPTSGLLAVGGLAVLVGASWLLAVRDGGDSENGGVQTAPTNTPSESGGAAPQLDVDPEVHLDNISRTMAVLAAVAIALLLTSTTLDYGPFVFRGREDFGIDVVSYATVGLVTVASLGLTTYRYFHKSSTVPTIAYRMSTYGMVIYAVACTVFVGWITNTSADQPLVGLTSIVLGSITPSILLICLVQSIAPSSRTSDKPKPGTEPAPSGDAAVARP
jgi:hypothetical protein